MTQKKSESLNKYRSANKQFLRFNICIQKKLHIYNDFPFAVSNTSEITDRRT